MKILIISVGVVLLLVMIFQIAVAVSTGRTERQRYRLIKRDGEVEIRFYPEAIMATVVSPDGTYRGSANRNFGRLAGYIFGGNKKAEKIAMTAPVHMSLGATGSSMSFVMPSKHSADGRRLHHDRDTHIPYREDVLLAREVHDRGKAQLLLLDGCRWALGRIGT